MANEVFISYSRKDFTIVDVVKKEIDSSVGIDCWMDLNGIESGEYFKKVIISAINRHETLLFMLTPNSMASDFALKELNFAIKKKKRVILVDLAHTQLNDDFLFDYSDKDNIDWNDPLQHKKLIENLKIWYPNDINNHERADLQKSAANQEGNVPVSLGSVQELQEQIAQAEAAKKELEKKMRLAEEEKRLAEEILPRMNINNVNINSNLIHADAAAKVLDNSNNRLDFIVNGVPFSMIKVEGGTFMMGATPEQGVDASLMERPSHQVTLSDYYIGETLVTQALWQSVMGNNPSIVKNDQHPVENVSWEDCQKFIQKLRSLTGQQFRIPTEAEWEFAARGGNKSRGYKYAGGDDINKLAWYNNSRIGWYSDCTRTTQAVKLKLPNELGIYDMSGNLQEWCQDWYDDYENSSQTNPKGPISGRWKVTRGGSCDEDARKCRVSWRDKHMPMSEYNRYIGIRLSL